jgi:hypothetical protein
MFSLKSRVAPKYLEAPYPAAPKAPSAAMGFAYGSLNGAFTRKEVAFTNPVAIGPGRAAATLGGLNELCSGRGVIGVCALGGRNGFGGVNDLTAGGVETCRTACAGTMRPPVPLAESELARRLIMPVSPPALDSGDRDVLNWLPGFFTPGVLGAEYLSSKFDSTLTLEILNGSYVLGINCSGLDQYVGKFFNLNYGNYALLRLENSVSRRRPL